MSATTFVDFRKELRQLQRLEKSLNCFVGRYFLLHHRYDFQNWGHGGPLRNCFCLSTDPKHYERIVKAGSDDPFIRSITADIRRVERIVDGRFVLSRLNSDRATLVLPRTLMKEYAEVRLGSGDRWEHVDPARTCEENLR